MESESVWRALSSPHRRKILDLLREGPRTTGELSRSMPDLSRFAVMQHLGVLEEAELVLPRREGRMRFNCLNPMPLRELYERWMSSHASLAAETALHLKRYAETTQQENQMNQDGYRMVRIEMEMRINAPRERVFAALTSELGNWWPHRWKEGSQVYCDAREGGAMGERFPDGGGAIYGSIVFYDPPSKLQATGPSSLHRGLYSFSTDTLEQDGNGTLLKREALMWGNVPDEVEKMFREGTRAIFEQALKAYCEEGVEYQQ